ncbi:MAG: hypothetical protein KF890_00925 [Nitrospira sp.]|nr:hypothetical protein [Nitrospira sp.]
MRASLTALSLAQMLLGASILEAGELPNREPLDVLWEQSMLEGKPNTNIAIQIEDGQTRKSEFSIKERPESWRRSPEGAGFKSQGITAVQYGEGFWENGGWELVGGLLGRAKEGSSTIELYGKAVIHRLPYFPFPFLHRDKPRETGYEFFLLQREAGSPQASIVRKWTFPPQEVVLKHERFGPMYEDVRAIFEYNDTTQRATVTITGLTRPFKESVGMSEREGEGDKREYLEAR